MNGTLIFVGGFLAGFLALLFFLLYLSAKNRPEASHDSVSSDALRLIVARRYLEQISLRTFDRDAKKIASKALREIA